VQAEGGEAFGLDGAGGLDPGADGGGGLGVAWVGQVAVRHPGYLDVQVDAVEQGAGEAAAVALQHGRGAVALPQGVAEKAAVAWVCVPLPTYRVQRTPYTKSAYL
jgi:hypothetical protein